MNDSVQSGQQNKSKMIEYVTVIIAGQLFGLPISRVEDVFFLQSVTRVPLSCPEVAGVLNLRGRIVTAINMRQRLGVPPCEESGDPMAVGIAYKGESYGLIIDQVGEVLNLSEDDQEPNPANLDPRWRSVSKGVHKLKGELMVVLDVDEVLGVLAENMAA